MAGAGLNGIKSRIKSVKSTQQITGAMELVATSKLRRAKERVERTRPFTETLREAIEVVASMPEVSETVYTAEREGKTLYVVIAGDRGLAGGYNANLFRLTARLIKDGDVVLPIGKKSCEHYRSKSYPTLGEVSVIVSDLGVGEALAIGDAVSAKFVSGEFARVVLVYTKFVSMITQTAVYEQLLPMKLQHSSASPECDGDPEEMLAAIVPRYVGGVVYSAICEIGRAHV